MEWQKNHKTIHLHGQTISYVDSMHGENVLLILHGFASSSYEYYKTIEELKKSYRVIIPDLIGFGFSSKPKNYFYTSKDEASLLTVFLKELHIKKISVIAQGFGVCILDEIQSIINLGFVPLKIDKVIFLNSRIQLALTKDDTELEVKKNRITSSLMKLSMSYGMFRKNVKLSFFKENVISENDIKDSWEILNYNDGLKTFNFIDAYMLETLRFAKNRLKNLKSSKADKFVIWGKNDDYDSEESFEKIKELLQIDTKKMFKIEECGYFPMFEKPTEFIQIMQELKKSA